MKNHISLICLLLSILTVYAFSPFSVTLTDHHIRGPLRDRADIRPGFLKLPCTGSVFHVLFSNVSHSSDESGTIFFIRKKRAVTRNIYDKIRPETLKESPEIHGHSVDTMFVAALYSPIDHHYSYVSYAGFLLFSGISPPS